MPAPGGASDAEGPCICLVSFRLYSSEPSRVSRRGFEASPSFRGGRKPAVQCKRAVQCSLALLLLQLGERFGDGLLSRPPILRKEVALCHFDERFPPAGNCYANWPLVDLRRRDLAVREDVLHKAFGGLRLLIAAVSVAAEGDVKFGRVRAAQSHSRGAQHTMARCRERNLSQQLGR